MLHLSQAQTCLTKAMAPVQRRKKRKCHCFWLQSFLHLSMFPPVMQSVGTQTQWLRVSGVFQCMIHSWPILLSFIWITGLSCARLLYGVTLTPSPKQSRQVEQEKLLGLLSQRVCVSRVTGTVLNQFSTSLGGKERPVSGMSVAVCREKWPTMRPVAKNSNSTQTLWR